jgi:hypothetical protein
MDVLMFKLKNTMRKLSELDKLQIKLAKQHEREMIKGRVVKQQKPKR